MKALIFIANSIAVLFTTVFFASTDIDVEKAGVADNKIESSVIVETIVPDMNIETIDFTNDITEGQMIEIECSHCHEHFSVDLNLSVAQCPHCLHIIDFEG